jgi:ribonuclease Z
MLRWLGIGVGVAAAVVGAGFLALTFSPDVQDAVIRRVAEANIGQQRTDLFADDALRVVLCGTGSPLPDPTRAKSCTMVIAGGKYYLVDIGPEATKTVMRLRLPIDRVGAVFLTHFHSDHIGELGEFNMQSWVQGRQHTLPVYGPTGVGEIVAGFLQAYRLDQGYRTAHHGAALMSPEMWPMVANEVATTSGQPAVALRDGELTVTAISVDHSPIEPSVGYRFDYKGRSVVISGDTAKHMPLATFAKDADILVHEAQAQHLVGILNEVAIEKQQQRLAKILGDIQNYHSSPVDAAEVANAAGVKLLVLTHFTPPAANFLVKNAYMRGLDDAREGEWDFGEDGRIYELPIGSSDIHIRDMD